MNNIAASGSALRKFFAYLLQSATRAKDRTEKAVTLGLEALPSVPEFRTAVTTKESDGNLHGCAPVLCEESQSSSRAPAAKQQQSSPAAAKQQLSSKAAAKQGQSRSKAAAKQQSSTTAAPQQHDSSKAGAK